MAKNNLNMEHKVVLPNNFIKNYVEALNLRQMKEFRLIVSCIDTNKPTNTIYISKKVLWEYFKKENPNAYLSNKYKYTTLKYDFDSLQSLKATKVEPNGHVGYGSLITWTDWSFADDDDLIEVTLNEKILPEFCELKNSLRYQPLEIVGFQSKYTLLLYELLLAEKWKNKGSIIIPIDYWKQKTGTVDKYNRFEAWYRKVIKVAVDEINNKTSYHVDCIKLPQERTKEKTDLQLYITEKSQMAVIDVDVMPSNYIYDRWAYYDEMYKDRAYGSQAVNRVRKSFEYYLQFKEPKIEIAGQVRATERLRDSLQRCKPVQIEKIIEYLISKKCVVTDKYICQLFWEMDRNIMFEKTRDVG